MICRLQATAVVGGGEELLQLRYDVYSDGVSVTEERDNCGQGVREV